MSLPRSAFNLLSGVSLTHRIVFYILLVAAVPVVLVALVTFRAASQGIKHHTQGHLRSVVIVKAQEVERWFRPLEATALVLAGNPDVKSDVALLLAGKDESLSVAASAHLFDYFHTLVERQIGLHYIGVVS